MPSSLPLATQDTRRILQEEISSIRTEIFRRESSVKYEEDKKRANELGYGDLSHLQEQLAKTEARLDRAKQSLYFPECKGYRCAAACFWYRHVRTCCLTCQQMMAMRLTCIGLTRGTAGPAPEAGSRKLQALWMLIS